LQGDKHSAAGIIKTCGASNLSKVLRMMRFSCTVVQVKRLAWQYMYMLL
jgi:hypothetical protein